MYDFYLNKTLINDSIIEISYSENIQDVGTFFEFTSNVDFGITSEINGKETINCFEICPHGTRNTVYLGYITDCEHTNNINVYKYSGFDVGFYLKNNHVIKKLDGNIGNEISKLCKENEINLGILKEFTQTIKRIYKGEAFDDILKELLELEKTKGGAKDYYIDCKDGKLNILQYQIEESLIVPIAQALSLDGLNSFNNATVTHSVQKLRNRVIVTDNASDKIIQYKQKKDDDSIATYGLLTHLEKVDTNKTNNLVKIASDKLKELNKVEETINLSIIGDYRAGKGKIIPVNLEEYGLIDSFLILSAKHKIYNNREEIQLSLKRYNEKTT